MADDTQTKATALDLAETLQIAEKAMQATNEAFEALSRLHNRLGPKPMLRSEDISELERKIAETRRSVYDASGVAAKAYRIIATEVRNRIAWLEA